MKTLSATLKVLTCAVFILALSSLAQAQTRTWVSGVGNDANPCSRTAPCKTFAGAISKTSKDGEIDALDPGGYGTVTITKSITIDGQGTLASILAAGTTGVIVNVTDAADVRKTVRLRNISFNGAASGVHGINGLAFNKLYVESCQIAGFQSSASSRGIKMVITTAGQAYIKDTDISNSASGIEASSTVSPLIVVMDKVRLEGMTDGLVLGNNTGGTFRDSTSMGMTGIGVKLSGSAGMTLERALVNHNGTGLQPGAGTTTILSNTTIIGNSTGIATTGGSVTSHGNNQISFNTIPGAIPTGGAVIGQQ